MKSGSKHESFPPNNKRRPPRPPPPLIINNPGVGEGGGGGVGPKLCIISGAYLLKGFGRAAFKSFYNQSRSLINILLNQLKSK